MLDEWYYLGLQAGMDLISLSVLGRRLRQTCDGHYCATFCAYVAVARWPLHVLALILLVGYLCRECQLEIRLLGDTGTARDTLSALVRGIATYWRVCIWNGSYVGGIFGDGAVV